MIKDNTVLELLKECSKSKKIDWNIDFKDGLNSIEFLLDYLPSHWNYSNIWFLKLDRKAIRLTQIETALNMFSKLKLKIFQIFYQLSEEEHLFIKKLIELPNIRVSLRVFTLFTNTLNDALDILKSLTKWIEIEEIILNYSFSGTTDKIATEQINSVIRKFHSKVGLINKLQLIQS